MPSLDSKLHKLCQLERYFFRQVWHELPQNETTTVRDANEYRGISWETSGRLVILRGDPTIMYYKIHMYLFYKLLFFAASIIMQPFLLRSSLSNAGTVGDVEDEDGYFSTYSHYSIHEEMLKVRKVNIIFEQKLAIQFSQNKHLTLVWFLSC